MASDLASSTNLPRNSLPRNKLPRNKLIRNNVPRNNLTSLNSAIYSGWVSHHRYSPVDHGFKYRVFMMYLDLDEIDRVLSMSPFWSKKRYAAARFKREDFHGDPCLSLRDAIDKTLADAGKTPCTGPIRMLVNLRYFGYNMNPLSTYYCFDEDGETLKYIIAEVHNTPWNQRHSYVLECNECSTHSASFPKEFHVSPFNQMQMEYRWSSTTPGEQLGIAIQNWSGDSKVMDASISLTRSDIQGQSLNFVLLRFPFMTFKVIAAIYWQALLLWWKKVPYVPYPGSNSNV